MLDFNFWVVYFPFNIHPRTFAAERSRQIEEKYRGGVGISVSPLSSFHLEFEKISCISCALLIYNFLREILMLSSLLSFTVLPEGLGGNDLQLFCRFMDRGCQISWATA